MYVVQNSSFEDNNWSNIEEQMDRSQELFKKSVALTGAKHVLDKK